MATAQIVFLTMTILDEIYNENRRCQSVNYRKEAVKRVTFGSPTYHQRQIRDRSEDYPMKSSVSRVSRNPSRRNRVQGHKHLWPTDSLF